MKTVAVKKSGRPLSAWVLSTVIHGLLLIIMVFGVQWQMKSPSPVQAELWNALPPVESAGHREPERVAPPPEPEPKRRPPPKPVEVPKAKPVEAPKPEVKPDIVSEKIKKDKKQKDEKPEKNEKAEKEKSAEDLLKELDRQKQDELQLRKVEREKKEKIDREKALKDLDRQAQTKKEVSALEDERKAGQARNQQVVQGYIDKIIAKIKMNTNQPPSVSAGRTVRFSFVVLPDGTVLEGSIKLLASSGQSAYDDAVSRAILASQPLPMPEDAALKREFRNIDLKVTSQ